MMEKVRFWSFYPPKTAVNFPVKLAEICRALLLHSIYRVEDNPKSKHIHQTKEKEGKGRKIPGQLVHNSDVGQCHNGVEISESACQVEWDPPLFSYMSLVFQPKLDDSCLFNRKMLPIRSP